MWSPCGTASWPQPGPWTWPGSWPLHLCSGVQWSGLVAETGSRDGDHVLVDVVAMRMVQVAVVQVIDMAIMADGRVAAAGAMGVVMVGVMGQLAFAHDDLLSAIDDAIIYP